MDKKLVKIIRDNFIDLDVARYVCVYAHAGQYRKDYRTPYFCHPFSVANRLKEYCANDLLIAAALLHDVLEDTNVDEETLREIFPYGVVDLVVELTNPSKGLNLPRSERKRIDREHLKNISNNAKIIKMFDRVDNICDLKGFDKDFIKLYMDETLLMLEVIKDADINLATKIKEKVYSILESIKNENS